ncbi:hypothetical protein [Devosia lacusdianchii]|uniref:hypothetical protein n=1 Tax=Devosia lacusdianchii TaxID=2917991 RepID=UPI001F067E83|nr:hypothetical protein [Devosia sp. JXJ CY 41]
MCGIFGILLKPGAQVTSADARQWLEDLYKLSESRGKESAGLHISAPANGTAMTLKGALPATEFIRTAQFHTGYTEAAGPAFAANSNTGAPLALVAHSRLVTNGAAERPENNQPVRYGDVTMVHNGIIVNVDNLWSTHADLQRTAEVDTQVMAALIASRVQAGATATQATQAAFQEISGAASIAWTAQCSNLVVIATNTGDIYYAIDSERGTLTFASERYILKTALHERGSAAVIEWLTAGSGLEIDLETLSAGRFDLHEVGIDMRNVGRIVPAEGAGYREIHIGELARPAAAPQLADEKLIRYDEARIGQLKRCSKCILPETFPFIAFDEQGVCNYCHGYKTKYKGLDAHKTKANFIASLEKYRRNDGNPSVIVPFSGGRDSSFGLHLIKKEFNLNPITFTYDWGMVTDLARRNIARICGQLGVQNILVSADIRAKRANIRKNVSAWLKQPDLGMVPLFMAGDKHFFAVLNQLKRQTGVSLNIWSANPLENTDFKSGFCGVAPDFGKSRLDYLSSTRKAMLAMYYASRFTTNPRYINSSLADTFGAFLSYYFEPRGDFYNLFDGVAWNEQEVDGVLLDEYDWELSPDSPSTWRIGDGTAPFYNYIYMTAKGFTEFDTFRSNQIREGMITREEALQRVLVENRPRVPSLKWYLETVGLDFNSTITKVNSLDTMGLHKAA